MRILAFESSCDECSVAVVRDGRIDSVVTHTQTVHQSFGGVVPELAGRSHLELIDGLCTEALDKADTRLSQIDVVAATSGPGLVGSLLVGLHYAQGIAQSTRRPFRQIHHMEAHLYSGEIESGELPVPFLVLLVSGGHTLLVLVRGLREYEILGSTLDDALGEAYDKVGKLVGLSFPAGADVDRLAAQGNEQAFEFPLSLQDASFNFSYSGLKTAFRYTTQDLPDGEPLRRRSDLLASFQSAALRATMSKVERAVAVHSPRAVVAAGGVSANSRLRKMLRTIGDRAGIDCTVPAPSLCADNAAMIGYLAWKLEAAGVRDRDPLRVRPRWTLDSLNREVADA